MAETGSGRALGTWTGHAGAAVSCAFSPGGQPGLRRQASMAALVDRFANNAYDLVIEGESCRRRQKPRFTP